MNFEPVWWELSPGPAGDAVPAEVVGRFWCFRRLRLARRRWYDHKGKTFWVHKCAIFPRVQSTNL